MVELSKSVVIAIEKTFHEADWKTVSKLLRHQHADNLQFMHDVHEPARFDRGRMALLKLSNGNLNSLQKGIALGKRDWRDLVMAAGFGQSDAHLNWYQSILAKPEGPDESQFEGETSIASRGSDSKS